MPSSHEWYYRTICNGKSAVARSEIEDLQLLQSTTQFSMLTLMVVVIAVLTFTVGTVNAELLLPIPQVIVALGDSFAAGNGANYYDTRIPECFRSSSSWAAQFADMLQTNHTSNSTLKFLNRGCSEGVFEEITNDRYLGTVRKDRTGNCPNPPFGADDFYVKKAKSLKCDHFAAPQIRSLDETVDLVLFAMGANDLQFVNLIKKCFIVVFRDVSGCQDQMDFVRENAVTWSQNLANTLMAMHPLLKPTARVVLMQFPHITMDVPYTYNPIIGGSVELTNNLRTLGLLLDDSQRNAVTLANAAANRTFVVYYDQAKAVFAGHEPNPRVFCRNPDGWFTESWALVTDEIYHFNPTGHFQFAKALYNFMVPLIQITPTVPFHPIASAPILSPV